MVTNSIAASVNRFRWQILFERCSNFFYFDDLNRDLNFFNYFLKNRNLFLFDYLNFKWDLFFNKIWRGTQLFLRNFSQVPARFQFIQFLIDFKSDVLKKLQIFDFSDILDDSRLVDRLDWWHLFFDIDFFEDRYFSDDLDLDGNLFNFFDFYKDFLQSFIMERDWDNAWKLDKNFNRDFFDHIWVENGTWIFNIFISYYFFLNLHWHFTDDLPNYFFFHF